MERLASLIERESGNVVPEGQYPYLREVAAERVRKTGFSELASYLDALEAGRLDREWRCLLPEITIKESYLFRIPKHFRALREEILPRLVENRTDQRTLRVWSAGCARGEEAGSLAVALADTPCVAGRQWRVLATDVDQIAIEQARSGEYSERAVARVPKHLLDRYFHRRGDKYLLSRELLDRIEFHPFNLFKDPLPYLDVPFDIIFLRNVLIYFRPESQRRVLGRIARRLAADGYLFLGHSETLWQLNEELEIVELTDCMAYRFPRPPDAPGEQRPPSRRRGTTPAQRAAVRAALRLKKRISEQTEDQDDARLVERPASADPGGAPDSGQQIEAAVKALAANGIGVAKDLIQRRLKANSTDAHAHALQGLIHDLEGRARRAVAAYRAALFLEPDLYQIRFLLAGRLDHLGWSSRARSEYRHVLSGLESGRGHELTEHLPELLPSRDEAAQRCRRALRRV